jgi:hypothetical protein
MVIPYKVRRTAWVLRWAVTRRLRILLWRIKGRPVPDVGALVRWGHNSYVTGPGYYRVTHWRRARPFLPEDPDAAIAALLREVIAEDPPFGPRWEFCLREEATHVGMSGIAGARAPIGEVAVDGYITTAPAVASEKRRAMLLGSRHERAF